MTIELPLWMQNNDYPARLDRALIFHTWDEGVMDLAAFTVTQHGAGDMTVDISAGSAVVQGDDQLNQGSYLVSSTASENLGSWPTPPGSNSRYDIVVLRVNDTNAGWTNPSGGGTVADVAQLAVIAGTPAASPVPPATPSSAILLATVGPITPSTTQILTSMITDSRPLAGRKCAPGTVETWTGPETRIPNGWLVEGGQAVSRTTYAALHALYAAAGYPYGNGDGSTTFNLRDKRGRVGVGLDNMGGTDAGRLSVGNALGGSGGSNIPTTLAHTHTGPSHVHSGPSHTHTGAPHIHDITHGHSSSYIRDGLTFDNYIVAAPQASSGVTAGLTLSPSASASGAIYASVPDFEGDSGAAEFSASTGASGTADTGASGTANTGSTGSTAIDGNLQPYILENSIVRT